MCVVLGFNKWSAMPEWQLAALQPSSMVPLAPDHEQLLPSLASEMQYMCAMHMPACQAARYLSGRPPDDCCELLLTSLSEQASNVAGSTYTHNKREQEKKTKAQCQEQSQEQGQNGA
jgi:hypothetical protein